MLNEAVFSGHPFARNEAVFRFWISQLWFVRYSRARGLADTSGFEHVFMGEVNLFFHNQLQRSYLSYWLN